MLVKKITFYNEIAYVVGLISLALGSALTAFGGFGISTVVAPAYVLHLFVSQFLPFFSFGVAEYALQATVLVLMMLILRKVKVSYLLSFVTVIFYGFALDGAMLLVSFLPEVILARVAAYIIGMLICCAAIALLFYSYLPPEVYELIVKEVAARFNKPIHRIKIIYDCSSLVVAVILSLCFFGELRGIGVGTVVCAFACGFIIRGFQKIYERFFRFEDRLQWRAYFEKGGKNL